MTIDWKVIPDKLETVDYIKTFLEVLSVLTIFLIFSNSLGSLNKAVQIVNSYLLNNRKYSNTINLLTIFFVTAFSSN